MNRIPFTLDAWLKDKSQRVETMDGRPVKIISFEMTDTNDCPIAAQFRLCAGTPVVYLFDKGGHYRGEGDSDYDLFIVTPEEELTEFEKAIKDMIKPYAAWPDDIFKEESAKLLSIAREQFIKDGYVIEKKAFHDAVEKVSSEVMKEVSVKKDEIFERRRQTLPTSGEVEGIVKSATDYMRGFSDGASTYIPKDMKEALRAEYEKGKADALKDLPRWNDSRWIYEDGWLQDGFLYYRNHSILLKDLEKLPGFKED